MQPVEIPEAAVEDALRAFVEHRIDTKESRMRAALGAALPYLAPAGAEAVHLIADGEAVTSCCGRTPFELPRTDRLTVDPKSARGCAPLGDGGNHHWSPRTKERPDAGPVHPCLTCDEKMACTGPSCGLHSVLLGERTGENALAEWLEYVFTTGDDITWEAAAQELFNLGAIREQAETAALDAVANLRSLLAELEDEDATQVPIAMIYESLSGPTS